MNGSDFADDVKRQAAQLRSLVRRLPDMIGAEVLDSINTNFGSQAFHGSPWEPRKNGDTSRALLVQSGRLRGSFSYETARNQLTVRSDAPYAQIHNEGGRITAAVTVRAFTRKRPRTGPFAAKGNPTQNVREHTRNVDTAIPQRQFLGEHPELDKRLERLFFHQISRIFVP
jgi:phage gpG-like protein